MKIVQINAVSNGSTGKIMLGIHKELLKRGHDSYVVFVSKDSEDIQNKIVMNDKLDRFIHLAYSRLTGKQGFASWKATKELIHKLNEINPDIIHLHNLHSSFINIEILFQYLREKKIKTIWTFHDCWGFTGKCVHFSISACEKWRTECGKCPVVHESPKAYIDNSSWCFQKKKEILRDMNLTIVTPSEWLAGLVKESFLKNYPVKVIHNGIDIQLFQKTNNNIREKYNINHKKMILGVANVWNKAKGLDDFLKLSKILDEQYVIMLVGLNETQLKELPNNIIGIMRTENQKELADIYSTADVFFNPTYQDNYPTVNLEAIACGTPALTYDSGGSPEFVKFINEYQNDLVIAKAKVKNNIGILKEYIDNAIAMKNKFQLIDKKMLDESTMVDEYLKLYKDHCSTEKERGL